MDDFKTGIHQISEDDVDYMEFNELCEYLSMNNLDANGTKSDLVERFKLFLRKVPVQEETTTEAKLKGSETSMPSSLFDYESELNKLKKVVIQIKNKNNVNNEPSGTDETFLEEMATEVISRMPIFMPKYPGFHTYDKFDSHAQDYIRYLPKDFKHEKYAAVWTTPNGRKCPSF